VCRLTTIKKLFSLAKAMGKPLTHVFGIDPVHGVSKGLAGRQAGERRPLQALVTLSNP
jgi:hypothetical protein